MLQTTNVLRQQNGGESRSGKKIPRRQACRFDSGLGHQIRFYNDVPLHTKPAPVLSCPPEGWIYVPFSGGSSFLLCGFCPWKSAIMENGRKRGIPKQIKRQLLLFQQKAAFE
ncbi:hypothetical protein [Kerstersia similis]|uniref:hypothetical protein n=1 Tax=Kerstersia similis TaxID=206505 RepID=UPI0039F000F3